VHNSRDHADEAAIERVRCLVPERLVEAFQVVELEVATDPDPRFARGVVRMEVDLFVLQRAPKSLHENVVDAASLAVHADLDSATEQYARERLGGELRPLVGVEDLGLRKVPQGLFERLDTEPGVQRVRPDFENGLTNLGTHSLAIARR
jgi:hypothetical protein